MNQITEKTDSAALRRIEVYLSDLSNEEKLFNDWYHGLNQPDTDPDIIPVSTLPPLWGIKKMFDEWFDNYIKPLKPKICELNELFSQEVITVGLIATIADLLGSFLVGIPVNLSAATTILLTKGYIQNLCAEEKSDGR